MKNKEKSYMNKLVSVIIPTYESSLTIRETLDSVLNQTYKNIEIILVDDFSYDFLKLKKIVDSYHLDFIFLYRQPKNLNGAAARNKGVDLSKGEIICFLDSDDLWDKNKIELQLSAYKPGHVVSCMTYSVNRGELNKAHKVKSTFDVNKSCYGNLFGSLEHNLVLQTSSIMISKFDFQSIGGFDASLFRHQDYQLIYSIDYFNLKVIFINSPLSFYVKDDRTAIQKGWSISRSDFFLSRYRDGFTKTELLNFMVVQLLGPSLKNNNIILWFRLCIKYKISLLKLFYYSLIYLTKRFFR